MLAGVILPLCLAPFEAIAQFPVLGLAVFLTWVVMSRINRLLAVPVAVFVAVLLIALGPDFEGVGGVALWVEPTLVAPSFTLSAVIGISAPLFIITMASQNITGMAVLSTFGFKPDAGSMFRWTGAFSLIAAPFGSHAVNLAAITAAICAGDEAHPEPSRRYWSAVVAGIAYVAWGLTAAVAVSFINVSPPILIEAVAGLALLGALAASLVAALSVEGGPDRRAHCIPGHRIRGDLLRNQRRVLGIARRRRAVPVGPPAGYGETLGLTLKNPRGAGFGAIRSPPNQARSRIRQAACDPARLR